jgi:hypothetical protein
VIAQGNHRDERRSSDPPVRAAAPVEMLSA